MLNIRKMELKDEAWVVDKDKEFFSGPAVDHPVSEKALKQTFHCALKNGYPLDGYILEDEGGKVGFSFVTWYHSTDVAGLCVMIEEIFICPGARGKGYGPKLIQYLFRQYKDAKRFRLEVTKENESACHVYKKLGFEYISYDQMYIEAPLPESL